MKKFKIVLDIVMTILMIVLMKTNITGLKWHEILGIGVFVLFVLHKLLNLKWIKSIGANFFSKKLQTKTKVQFVLGIILLIFVTANVVTGVCISRNILTDITFGNMQQMTVMHKFFAWWSLILISIHIGFHVKPMIAFFTSRFDILKTEGAKIVSILIYFVIALFGIFALCKKDVYQNLVPHLDNNDNNKLNEDQLDLDKPSRPSFDGETSTDGNKARPGSSDDKKDDKENNSNSNSNSSSGSTNNNTTSGGTPTLNEFLSKLTCSGCGKRCLLTNPKCSTGMNYQSQKIEEYNKLYGDNTVTTSTISYITPVANTSSSSSNSGATYKQNGKGQQFGERDQQFGGKDQQFDGKNFDGGDFEPRNNQDFKNTDPNEITKANLKGISVIDYISIMGLFIGGTYFTVNLTENNKKKNS